MNLIAKMCDLAPQKLLRSNTIVIFKFLISKIAHSSEFKTRSVSNAKSVRVKPKVLENILDTKEGNHNINPRNSTFTNTGLELNLEPLLMKKHNGI